MKTRHSHRHKSVFFLIEGINSVACTYYFNYLFFLLRDQHGFGNKENLLVSALHGFLYIFAAWQAGRFAERYGYLHAIRLGGAGMTAALAAASAFPALSSQIVCFAFWTIAMTFTWPALEALVAHGESPAGLQKMIGIYNCVWAGASAAAFFAGGAAFDRLGLGSLYWLPAALYLFILVLIAQVAAKLPPLASDPPAPHPPDPAAFRQPVPLRAFVRMAWLANPFAYIAINTVTAVIPDIARRFDLSATQAGLLCSVWFFARFAAFLLLWRWTAWHYRFRWMLAGFVGLILTFALILLSKSLWLVVAAQLAFGFSAGIIYYSSLFYSMDASEAKGEHGGLHEAAIGVGIFAGPIVGAAALHLRPDSATAGAWAVIVLLGFGLLALLGLRFFHRAS